MSVYVGISGWTYEGWRGTFYPPRLPHREELHFASLQLPSIEINGTFYSLQRPQSFARWFEATPEDFVFSLKAHRYITHVKRLKDVEIPIANFLASGPLMLEHKLAAFLWQFPPSLIYDPDRLEHFLELLPRETEQAQRLARKSTLPKERKAYQIFTHRRLRHAVEVRNDSFLNPYFVERLRAHNVAVVFADTAGRWPYMEDITADFIYARLHGDRELYVSGYDDPTLSFWAERIQVWMKGEEPKNRLTISDSKPKKRPLDAFIYFDNDVKVRAPEDARTLIRQLNDLQEGRPWA